MTQEQKDILLKDLAARLPYGVVIRTWYNKTINIKCINVNVYTNVVEIDIPEDDSAKVYIDNVKPYLFPLSSMTEEQRKEYESIIYKSIELHWHRYYDVVDVDDVDCLIDFYHKNHIDYRGLIPMGLANDATGLNIY